MKVLVILMLVGCASATLLEVFERESRNIVNDFTSGLQIGTPLHVALGIENSDEIQRFERDVKEELAKHVKDAFEKALKKITDALERGVKVPEKALELLQDLHEKMKELVITDEDLKEEKDALKAKVDEHLRKILEKMGIFDKRSLESEPLESIMGDLSLRDLFIKLKKMILEKMDIEAVKNSLAKVLGQGTQRLCEWLTNKGKQKVLNFFDRLLESDEESRKRASGDRFQEVKDYLENLEKDIENKVSGFRQWLHDLINSGLIKAEDRIKTIREIVKEVIAHSRDLSKKALDDVLRYLRENERELGPFLGDLRKKIEEILKKKD